MYWWAQLILWTMQASWLCSSKIAVVLPSCTSAEVWCRPPPPRPSWSNKSLEACSVPPALRVEKKYFLLVWSKKLFIWIIKSIYVFFKCLKPHFLCAVLCIIYSLKFQWVFCHLTSCKGAWVHRAGKGRAGAIVHACLRQEVISYLKF